MFKPRSDGHSLIEAVFGLVLDRPWSPTDVASVKNADGQWRTLLPKVNDVTTHQIVFGSPGFQFPVNAPATGVVYERVKPDGTIEWRMAIDQNSVIINCLCYTRWKLIWPQVLNLLRQVVSSVGATESKVTGILFQTVDSFFWEGDRLEYAVDSLLDLSGGFVPGSLLDRGQLWHLHQGWFSSASAGLSGRLLNRINIDAVETDVLEVKIDTTLHNNLEKSVSLSDILSAGSKIEREFDVLHSENKNLLKKFLSETASKSIKLE